MILPFGRRGFTLIELLIVIAIIAILAAILFPVFATARERGRQVQCLSNLRQLAVAFRQYAEDNRGLYPLVGSAESGGTPHNWAGCAQGVGNGWNIDPKLGSIWPYVKSSGVYVCPSTRNARYAQFGERRGCPLSYSMNYLLSGKNPDQVPNAKYTKMLLLIHESPETLNDGSFVWSGELDRGTVIHWNGTTVVYIDTHAKWQSFDQLNDAIGNRDWDPS